MKYIKCTTCHRKASRKYRGRHFCNDCLKRVRRDPRRNNVWTDKLVYTLGPGSAIYRTYIVKLK